MAEKIVTKGIVLRETQTKEADKILTVLTPDLGKVGVVARGARRKGSRIAAASELLAFSELVLYERHGWYLLDEASTLALFDGLRRDVTLLSLASYFAELTETVTSEGEGAGDVLALLLNALYALDTLGKEPETVRAAFELRLLSLSGYEPLLDGCAVCGREDVAEPRFDPLQGVVLCRGCAGAETGALLPLDGGALAAMRHVIRSERKKMLSFTLSADGLRRFSRACEAFAHVQLDRPFRTLDFYKSMRAAEEAPRSDPVSDGV